MEQFSAAERLLENLRYNRVQMLKVNDKEMVHYY